MKVSLNCSHPGLNATGQNILRNAGYQVEAHPKALDIEVLKEKIKDVHAIGLRSKTQLTQEVLECAKNLKVIMYLIQVIGCFCIGTNQVNLEYAASKGIAVFNSPFSNSRSVAELVIAEMIALSRQMMDRNTELHKGIWNKVPYAISQFRMNLNAVKSGGNLWVLLDTAILDLSYPFLPNHLA